MHSGRKKQVRKETSEKWGTHKEQVRGDNQEGQEVRDRGQKRK